MNAGPTRWIVLAGIFLLALITIVDRVAISAAKSGMAVDLQISDLTFGLVFGAFGLGYAVFMIPSGWLADRVGARIFLPLIVIAWSITTMLTGMATSAVFLVGVRFVFGMAEAGAFPAAALAIRGWFPEKERGLALGLLNTGSRVGAAAGIYATSLAVESFGWRLPFYALAAIGVVWSAAWFGWFRERNEPGPGGGPAAAGSRPPLKTRNTMLIVAQYFAQTFTFFICFSWLLPHLQSHFGLSAARAGILASVPIYAGALATWTSGLAVDWVYRHGARAWSRRGPAIAGYGLALLGVLASAAMQTPESFIVCFAIASFGIDFVLSPSWTTCLDVGGASAGTLSAMMNAAGSAGMFASSVAFPYLLKLTGDPKLYFYTAAALNAVAILCWILIRPPREYSAQQGAH